MKEHRRTLEQKAASSRGSSQSTRSSLLLKLVRIVVNLSLNNEPGEKMRRKETNDDNKAESCARKTNCPVYVDVSPQQKPLTRGTSDR